MMSTTLTTISFLFADIAITPLLLGGVSEIDGLHIALGCRFALVIFTISLQLSPTPDHEPLPHDPEFVMLLAGLLHMSADGWYRSVNILVLLDPWLTQ